MKKLFEQIFNELDYECEGENESLDEANEDFCKEEKEKHKMEIERDPFNDFYPIQLINKFDF